MKDATPDMVRELIRKGASFHIRAGGLSMFPLVLPGSRIEIRYSAIEELKSGALVVFERDGRLVCHLLERIERHGEDVMLRTKGLYLKDPPVTSSALIGVVRAVSVGPLSFGIPGFAWDVWRTAIGPAAKALWIASWGRRLVRGLLQTKWT